MVTENKEPKKKVTQQCSGIKCPECGGSSIVQNGKPMDGVHGRYRKCVVCGTTFYTEESIVRVIKLHGEDKKNKDNLINNPVKRRR